ncbi:hypothetical protein C8R43DRAFT_1230672 [Mycena crocata]|nr:hypothetical protein C8R43DRAFT_1230672 [Mycena crocata]
MAVLGFVRLFASYHISAPPTASSESKDNPSKTSPPRALLGKCLKLWPPLALLGLLQVLTMSSNDTSPKYNVLDDALYLAGVSSPSSVTRFCSPPLTPLIESTTTSIESPSYYATLCLCKCSVGSGRLILSSFSSSSTLSFFARNPTTDLTLPFTISVSCRPLPGALSYTTLTSGRFCLLIFAASCFLGSAISTKQDGHPGPSHVILHTYADISPRSEHNVHARLRIIHTDTALKLLGLLAHSCLPAPTSQMSVSTRVLRRLGCQCQSEAFPIPTPTRNLPFNLGFSRWRTYNLL